jgi:glycosyltransferase involved in cell wall biosynthesis
MHAAEHCRWPGVGTVTPIEPEWKKKRKDDELRLAAAVAVASAFTRASVPDDGSRRPVLVIPYGFPIDLFAPKSTLESERFTVLAVGSQSVRKGTHYLLQAWKDAALKGARLRLIGPMGLSRQFLRDFDGLYEHVPHLPRAKLQDEYQAADLLAFPTLGDGFGLVIQEAMCCGTPVLTTPCGGGPECLNSGEHGWIVSPRDIDALVDILREASRNRDRTKAMGRAARHRAEQWTWDDAARALVDGLSGLGLL